MRAIRISEEVWQAIADQGKFGETEDDVLHRVFNLKKKEVKPMQARGRFSTNKQYLNMTDNNVLEIEYAAGAKQSFSLPFPKDKEMIRATLEKATKFAEENDATLGQVNAIRKKLTDNGWHLTR